MDICTECGTEIIDGTYVTANQGHNHVRCYEIANPPIKRKTFKSVLVNCEDQVLVRQLLVSKVPSEIQNEIIESFNETILTRYKRRIA